MILTQKLSFDLQNFKFPFKMTHNIHLCKSVFFIAVLVCCFGQIDLKQTNNSNKYTKQTQLVGNIHIYDILAQFTKQNSNQNKNSSFIHSQLTTLMPNKQNSIRIFAACPCPPGQYCNSNACVTCIAGQYCPGTQTAIGCAAGFL